MTDSQQQPQSQSSHQQQSSSHPAGPSNASIQFDESSLSGGRNGTGSTRKRVQSSAANSNASSITVPAAKNATGAPPSISSSLNGSVASRSQQHRRKVITKPAWAQLDDEEEEQEEGGHEQQAKENTPSTSRAPGDSLPKSWAPSENKESQPSHDDQDLKGPGRFWTFTLPTKYRNRLHEHHLRMLRNEMVERDSAQGRVRRQSRSSERDSASSHSSEGSSSNDSDASSAVIVQGLSGAIPNSADRQKGNRHSRRSSGGGLGDVLASAGAAAGLGGQDSLIGWRRRQQEQRSYDPEKQPESSPDQSSEGPNDRAADEEKQDANVAALPATEMRARIPLHSSSDASLTRHQAQTPGWESPWHPEEMTGIGAIDVGGYTFATGGTGDGFFPRTDTRRSGASGNAGWRRRRRMRSGKSRGITNTHPKQTRNGMTSLSEKGGNGKSMTTTRAGSDEGWWADKWAWWKEFLMRNPFVPLLFRAINISFTTATLAVAIRLWKVLHTEGAADSVGSSPVVGIIFAPLSLLHVGAQVWLEYFSRPIGLWAVKSKLSYQLIELVFIALWSAELALSFDNYATSSLVCVSWYSPWTSGSSSARTGCSSVDGNAGSPLLDPSKKPYICRLQGALIGLTFTTLLAYVAVFSVSLFRTVVR